MTCVAAPPVDDPLDPTGAVAAGGAAGELDGAKDRATITAGTVAITAPIRTPPRTRGHRRCRGGTVGASGFCDPEFCGGTVGVTYPVTNESEEGGCVVSDIPCSLA